MFELEIGWATDLAVLEASGSTVEDRGDHFVVRTPLNPTYNWGNCIFVTDPAGPDDPARWVRAFEEAFPTATWTAIGLQRAPEDTALWEAHDLQLELLDVLVTSALPRATAAPDGYVIRRLAGDDWEQAVALAVAENDRTGSWEREAYEPFARARSEATRAVSERDIGAYFGAFVDGTLAASLGIVRCGDIGRFQNVLTAADHRRRGLASHLLGVAAHWSASYDCDQWVIVTEVDNSARRVYHRSGFVSHSTNVQAHRLRR